MRIDPISLHAPIPFGGYFVVENDSNLFLDFRIMYRWKPYARKRILERKLGNNVRTMFTEK